jgi:pimeloyl-ACP methyl ester carboxylesterase
MIVDLKASAGTDGWHRLRSFDGTAIAWREDGSETQRLPVVLCNGIACSDEYWRHIVAPLSADRRIVRWDYRAHGRSGAPADPQQVTVSAVVQDLEAVLSAAGVQQAVLVGHSFGVQVALEAVRSLRERAAGLVVITGAPGAPLPAMPAVLGVHLAAALNAAAPSLFRKVWQRAWRSPSAYWMARALGATTRNAPRQTMDAYFAHVGRLDPSSLLHMLSGMQAHSAADVLDGLTVPLLAIAGDADPLTGVRTMRQMTLRAPDAELAVVAGGSHTLPAEQPAAVLGAITPFLARVDTAVASATVVCAAENR